MLLDIDELKIYNGNDYIINEKIKIKQPTLDEICNYYGEKKYYNLVQTICSVGADLKWQLNELGIDYSKIKDFDLFATILIKNLNLDDTKILFGEELNFSEMQYVYNSELDENVLLQKFKDGSILQITEFTYNHIVSVLRKMNGLKRNDEVAGNEFTRSILIEDAKEEYLKNENKPYKSFLLPLISTMVNSSGFKRNEQDVFKMKIYSFMDSVKRIQKLMNVKLLLSSGYSGFGVDLKQIDKEELNMFS